MTAFGSDITEIQYFMTGTFGGGGVNVLGALLNCKLDLHVLQGVYRDNVLNAHVVPHFENHHARPHRTRIVREFYSKNQHNPQCQNIADLANAILE